MNLTPRFLAVASVGILAALVSSEAHAHLNPTGDGPCIPLPARPERGQCVVVDDDVVLMPSYDYHDVEFWFTAGGTPEDELVFDCRGATIRGGLGPYAALALHSHEGDPPLQHITVRNCEIVGYDSGIKVFLELEPNTRENIRSTYLTYFHEPKIRGQLIDAIEDQLRLSAPQNIRFENVHLRNAGNVGIYLFPYVHDVMFTNGSSRSAGSGPGIYMDTGSRDNVVEFSEIADNGREGIALDSSAFNVVRYNSIHDNDEGGIFLYRNPWEQPDRQIPRNQHSVSNQIIGNVIYSEFVGVWIGSRQSTGKDPGDRGDPIYLNDGGTHYFRDNAENTLVSGNAITAWSGVIVHDDGAQIVGNLFAGGVVGIDVGNSIRKRVGEPVHGTVLRDNVVRRWPGGVLMPVRLSQCASGTQAGNNVLLDSAGGQTQFTLPAVSCDQQRATLWSHFGDPSGFAYVSSVDRLAMFDANQRWVVGDFDGNGDDDVANIYGTSDGQARVWMHKSDGNGFAYKSSFQTMAGFVGSGHWLSGDFDGDGDDDLVHVYPGFNNLATAWVHLSDGEEFEYRSSVTRLAGFWTSQRWLVGDFSGDGKDDLVNVYSASGTATAWVHYSTGSGFEEKSSLTRLAGFWSDQRWLVGDFNRDDRDDLVNVYSASGTATAWVHHFTGRGFEYKSSLTRLAGFWNSQRWLVTDFNRDDRDDLVNVYGAFGSARAWRHASTGAGFEYRTGLQTLAGFWGTQKWLAGDFNGDGYGDLLDVYGASAW